MNQQASVMHKAYPRFLELFESCGLRNSAEVKDACFNIWLRLGGNFIEKEDKNHPLGVYKTEIDSLKREIRLLMSKKDEQFEVFQKTHNAQVEKIKSLEFQLKQSKLNAQILNQQIIDWGIYSAIWTVETYCRYRDSKTSLQVTPEDRANIEPVRMAWMMLKNLGVDIETVGNHGNMRIVYDKSQNPFFGRQ